MTLNKEYWEERYSKESLGWNIGYVSTPIKTYADQLTDKEIRILIPGAGFGYEAVYLYENGFRNVYVLDITQKPFEYIRKACPDFPKEQLIEADFFEADLKDFDLVLEQTFFCALDPVLRKDYVVKMHEVLKKGGKLAGLFFDFPLTENGPPFGGDIEEYRSLFEPYFEIKTLERSYNSIGPRQGIELFFIFEK